jgi:hypothetical protein
MANQQDGKKFSGTCDHRRLEEAIVEPIPNQLLRAELVTFTAESMLHIWRTELFNHGSHVDVIPTELL